MKDDSPASRGRASEPLRIQCADVDDIPPAEQLEKLAVQGRHVVLEVANLSEEGKASLVRSLAASLPNHRVFGSLANVKKRGLAPAYPLKTLGISMTGRCLSPFFHTLLAIAIVKVIDEDLVLRHRLLFLHAIIDFSYTAHDLASQLAASYGIPPEALYDHRHPLQKKRRRRLGDWNYDFHGYQCQFTNTKTGQVVDVDINPLERRFGNLDPYFLARFIRTTPAHHEAAKLLYDDYHDPKRVLEILRKRGYFG